MVKIITGVTAAALLVVCGWFYWAFYSDDLAYRAVGHTFPLGQAGSWGDSFGGFNALFGALGFTAVFATLLIQARALKLQQEDQHRQRFEASFFELMRLLRDSRQNVRFQYSAEYSKAGPDWAIPDDVDDGQAYMRAAVGEIRYWVRQARGEDESIPREQVSAIYAERIDARFGSRFAPYFRLLYTILRRISEDSVLTPSEKARYGNLVRSQLSLYDAQIISLNALSDVAGDLFQYVVEFRLLKYINKENFREFVMRYYPKEAFMARD